MILHRCVTEKKYFNSYFFNLYQIRMCGLHGNFTNIKINKKIKTQEPHYIINFKITNLFTSANVIV